MGVHSTSEAVSPGEDRRAVVGGVPGYDVSGGTVWPAVRSRPLLVIAIALLLTALGVAAALVRTPKYTSTARLAVQHFNFGASGAASGFSTAAPALADTYARSIDADGVINPLASSFHIVPGTLREELAAVAVPQSPVFVITATTTRSGLSTALADAAARQILTYEQSVNSTNPQVAPLLSQLTVAEGNLTGAISAKNALLAAINQAEFATHRRSPTSGQQRALAIAQAAVNVAQDKVNVLRSSYQQSFLSTSSTTQYLNPITAATTPTSDRSSRIELYGFVGLVVGIALGVAAAVLRRPRRPVLA